jgi:hypothetical protein
MVEGGSALGQKKSNLRSPLAVSHGSIKMLSSKEVAALTTVN